MIALKDSLGTEFVERVGTIFSATGRLSKSKNFEFRPQQQDMAVAVARSLEEERHLVVEAGTGVGKSLAYLVPAILFALERKKKAIVSTQTINLQEQLLHKDIPILKKVLPVEFETALMKGRQNYLCPRRLERALQQSTELFSSSEQNELQQIAEWARVTRDGSVSDLTFEPDPKVWVQVCSEAHICTQKTCGQQRNCFYQQARKRLLSADLVVINHTLLFMLLGDPGEQEERESGFLFPNDFIIFDEAHLLEQVASRQIGIGVSQYGLKSTIQRLYNARTRKGLFTVTRDAAGNETSRVLAGQVTSTGITGDDFVILGDANPKYTLGLHTNGNFRSFDFSVLINRVAGQKVFNNTALVYGSKGNALQDKNFLAAALNDPTGIHEPAIYSSRWIEDGSFTRLANVTIGYTFDLPRVIGVARGTRVYVSGDNLHLWTPYSGYDPEVFSQLPGIAPRGVDYLHYPRPRTITGGLRVQF